MNRFPLALFVAVCLAGPAGCSFFRWSGNKQGIRPQGEVQVAEDIRASRERHARKKLEPPRPEISEESLKPLFYSDLGPDEIDVSQYPTQQKYNYTIYARVCSQCHGLARSISAPAVGRAYWEFYMLSMRTRSGLTRGANITREEAKAILDFLIYDSKVRKTGENERDFNELIEELKRRFDPVLEKRLEELQKKRQPRLLPLPNP